MLDVPTMTVEEKCTFLSTLKKHKKIDDAFDEAFLKAVDAEQDKYNHEQWMRMLVQDKTFLTKTITEQALRVASDLSRDELLAIVVRNVSNRFLKASDHAISVMRGAGMFDSFNK